MCKKLMVLLLVLGLCGLASAVGTWDGGGSDSNWTTGANWDDDAVPPRYTNIVFEGYNYAVISTNIDDSPNLGKPNSLLVGQVGTGFSYIVLQSTGKYGSGSDFKLGAIGGAQFDAAAGSQMLIAGRGRIAWYGAADATFNLDGYCKPNGTEWKIQGGGGTSPTPDGNQTGSGYMNIGATGVFELPNGNLNISPVDTAGGVGQVTIAGLAVVKDIQIDGAQGQIIIDGGLLKILGDQTAEVAALMTAGKIVGTTTNVYDAATGYTYVPEPATIALLGLGGLLLRKKR